MVRRAVGWALVLGLLAIGAGCCRPCRCCGPRGLSRSAPEVGPAERIPPAALPTSGGPAARPAVTGPQVPTGAYGGS